MNTEQWRQVDRIFNGALDRTPAERMRFIERECEGDLSLHREVEALLSAHELAGNFLEAPAGEAARYSREAIAPGTLVGAYEVRSIIGEGGMGEVYRAHDAALKRDVAIKVLAEALAEDPERVSRFRREAEVLAKLNHPNIAAIYGLEGLNGRQALILELVEGTTLAHKVASGPIPLDEALAIARQIAEAIEAAHDLGIIHRDLKPSNIKITPNGKVKVLDFGLAKVGAEKATGGVNVTNATGMMVSTPGMILGTVAYMAPEQARGKAVDKRADIWAFGCVLYEMLTGHAPFARQTITSSLAAILERDPDWSALPGTIPANIKQLLRRCLEKDLQKRMGDIAEARLTIENALKGTTRASVQPVFVDRPAWAVILRWSSVATASLAVFIVLGVLAWQALTPSEADPRYETIASSGASQLQRADLRSLTITPDGKRVIYLGANRMVYVQLVGQFDPKLLYTGSVPVNYLFASHDGKSVGFVEGKTLKSVSIESGTVQTIYPSREGLLGATWAPDGTIIFAGADPETGLKRVQGGIQTVLTLPDAALGEVDHVWPEMLPGGRKVLFTITTSGGAEATQLAVFDIETKKYDLVMRGGRHAHYVSTGHLVYAAGGGLWAVAFNPVTLKTSGKPVEVLPRVVLSGKGGGEFDVASNEGTLVYVDAPDESLATGTLVWVYPGGPEIPLLGESAPARQYVHPRLSPDRKQIAVSMLGDEKGIWIVDVVTGTRRQFTTVSGNSQWTQDSKSLVYFLPGASGGFTLFRQLTAQGATPEALGNGPLSGVTLDGRILVSRAGNDIVAVATDGTRRVEELIKTDYIERNGVQSADGRWLAFESNKSGQFEIHMAEFAHPNLMQWQISSGGGNTRPLFSPDGKKLFYVASDGALMEAPLNPNGGRSGDTKIVIPAGRYLNLGLGGAVSARTYDFDGERFLMVRPAPKDTDHPTRIKVSHKWSEELKRLVPARP